MKKKKERKKLIDKEFGPYEINISGHRVYVPNCPSWRIKIFFFKEFQPMTSAFDDSFLSSY